MTAQVPPVAQDRNKAKAAGSRSSFPRVEARGSANGAEPLWPACYVQATPAERQQWIQQALQQEGILHDLPPSSGSSVLAATSPLLHDLLDGRLERLFDVAPYLPLVSPSEAAAAPPQQIAACAASTPDLFVLLALPGPERSRTIAEVLTQATSQGQRVLFVASETWLLDGVLEHLPPAGPQFALRLLAPGEDTEPLPKAVQALTAEARVHQLVDAAQRQQAEQAAQYQHAVEDAQRQLQRWTGWRERVAVWQTNHGQIEKWTAEHQALPDIVAKEREAATATADNEQHVQAFHAENQRHEARLQELNRQIQTAEALAQERKQESEKWQSHVQTQEEVVASRKQRNWLSLSWWKSAFHGRSEERLAEFRLRATEAEQDAQKAHLQVNELKQQLEIERQRHHLACEQILSAETERRRTALEQKIQQLRAEQDAILRAWTEDGAHANHSRVWTEQPTPLVVIEEIRRWETALQAAQQLLTQPAPETALSLPDLAELRRRLPAYVNLLAAPLAALTLEANGAKEEPCDLLVCLQADRLQPREFHALAARARRWVWCGQPVLPAKRDDSGEPSPFAQLVQRLLGETACTPRRWQEEEHFLTCELQPIASADHLQSEPLVDHPDVTLHIHAPPGDMPLLHAVAFPKTTFSLPQAKRFLATHLGELPLAPHAPTVTWHRTVDSLLATFATEGSESPQTITWERGIVETVVAFQRDNCREWQTQRLEFPCAQGWTWTEASLWLSTQIQLRDTGRLGCLPTSSGPRQEMLNLLRLLLEAHRFPIPVGATTGQESLSLPESRAVWWVPSKLFLTTVAENGQERTPPVRTLDLADPRQRHRIPPKLLADLPPRGMISLIEAQFLIRLLEHHLRTRFLEEGTETGNHGGSKIVVLAQHPAQVSLLEALWRQTEWWDRQQPCVRFTTVSRFREQQAEVAYVSLFRPSDLSSAAAFSEWLTLLTVARRHLVLVGDLPGRTRLLGESAAAWSRFLPALQALEVDAAWLPVDEGVPA
jgi:hypothetical protein